MAGTPSTIVSVTPGPVPPVSAWSGSLLLGSKDGVTPARVTHDDLLPPPPPSEPYEVFLARVGRATSYSSMPTTQPAAAALPSASVSTVTTGNHLPTPFPTYEVSSWMHQSQLQASRIRMPLPASFYTPLPSPWVWPGRGSAVTTSVVRANQPATPPAALAGLPGPTGHFPGSLPGGPTPIPPPAFLLFQTLKCTLLHPYPHPPRFRGVFFRVPRPLFVQPAGNPVPPSAPRPTSVTPTVTQPDAVNTSQGPSPDMIQSWKEEFMRDVKTCWNQFVGDAPPQPTVGPAVPSANMGPDSLRQLSPSDNREASRAQRKAGSKRADGGFRQSSRSSERSSTDRHRARVRHCEVSSDSSSPTRRLSPPAKTLTVWQSPYSPWVQFIWRSCAVSADSSSSEIPLTCTMSPWSITAGPGIARLPLVGLFETGMTRRLAGQPSLSPHRQSPASHRRSRRSSRGLQSSPPFRSRAPNRHFSLSSSRSPSPQGHKTCSSSSHSPCSRSASRDCISRPHEADQCLLRIREDDGEQYPPDSRYRTNQQLWMTLSCQRRKCKNCSQTF